MRFVMVALWLGGLSSLSSAAAASLDGTLEAYQQVAVASHPEIAEARSRAEAASARAGVAGRLPEPTLGVGVFVQPVETRVGPQQARVSLQQRLPWGRSALRAGAAAAATAAVQDAQSAVLLRKDRVAAAWWTLWELRATRVVHATHLDLLAGLSETLRARMEVGAATLADLQQVDLSRAILGDRIASMKADEAQAEAGLREAVGLPGTVDVPTEGSGLAASLPAADATTLLSLAGAHPEVSGAGSRVAVADAGEQAVRAARLPGMALGADWILTGPGDQATQDSGKDALAATVGFTVPLWQRAYRQELSAAGADRGAAQARHAAVRLGAVAEASALLVEVGDTARRLRVVGEQLLPQAEAAYRSLLGTYAAGEAGVAQVLLAQQTVLELRVAQAQAGADHARAWAALEARCGTPLERRAAMEEP